MNPAAPVINTLFNTFSSDFKVYENCKDTRNKVLGLGYPVTATSQEHQRGKPGGQFNAVSGIQIWISYPLR